MLRDFKTCKFSFSSPDRENQEKDQNHHEGRPEFRFRQALDKNNFPLQESDLFNELGPIRKDLPKEEVAMDFIKF